MNITELLYQCDRKFCIAGEWGALVRWRKENPWRWNRAIPRWQAEMIQEERDRKYLEQIKEK